MRIALSIVSIVMAITLVYLGRGHEIKPSQWHIENQIKSLRRIQNETKISDPVIREREQRYIQDQIDSLISGFTYDREEIGPEILVEAKP